VPVPASVHSALGELRSELDGKLVELFERRSQLSQELQAIDDEIKSRRRQLELVEATERQLAGQGGGQPDLEGVGEGLSHRSCRTGEPLWPTWCLCLCHDSLCQRVP
jgi:hypothetical protein